MFEHDVNVVSTYDYFKVNKVESISPEVEENIYSELANCNFLHPLKMSLSVKKLPVLQLKS
jgi:hypothetical protein